MSVMEWDGGLSRMPHKIREQRTRNYQWKHLKTWLDRSTPNHKEPIRSQITVTETSRSLHGCHVSHMHAHVIRHDIISNKLSYVACNTQHLLCCVQHSTFPVLNAINMFASCNPCIVTYY